MKLQVFAVAALSLALCSCQTVAPLRAEQPSAPPPAFEQVGIASWYGKTHQGRKTANGERFDRAADTAAHKSLPFNTLVKVTTLETGKSTLVRINDRGPMVKGRIIDLSDAAATELGIREDGIAKVRIEVVSAAH